MKDETKRRGGGRGERGRRVIHSRKFLSFQFQKFHLSLFFCPRSQRTRTKFDLLRKLMKVWKYLQYEYIYIYIHLLIHNRKKNRGSDILFPRRIFLTDSNKFGIQPNFYTMLRRSRFPTRRNKPHRDAKWNFTRGANGISDKLDDSNVAWEDFSLYHYSPTNLERARTFLSLRCDRSRIAAGRIKGE